MATDQETWALVHAERARIADLFDSFTETQWETMSLCRGWSVKLCAAHIMASGEQTAPRFMTSLLANGFRFNVMIDRAAHRLGQLETKEIIRRLRDRTTTTNKAPAPVVAVLGEVVVHGSDIRLPLGIVDNVAPAAKIASLNSFTSSNFPVPTKRIIEGLSLRATDLEWSFGQGPEVAGPSQSLLLAMTGRSAGLRALEGEGLETMSARHSKSAVS